jgi:hypothetical protein
MSLEKGIYIGENKAYVAHYQKAAEDPEFITKIKPIMDIDPNILSRIFNPSRSGVLPIGCRFIDVTQESVRVVIEQPPTFRHIKFEWFLNNEIKNLSTNNLLSKYEIPEEWLKTPPPSMALKLFFPYTIFVLCLTSCDGPIPKSTLYIYHTLKPLQSFFDPLFITRLPNVFDEDNVCFGNFMNDFKSNGDISSEVGQVVEKFWNSTFNAEASGKYTKYLREKHIGLFDWSYWSKKDPSRVMNTDDWIPTKTTIDSLLNISTPITTGSMLSTIFESSCTSMSKLMQTKTRLFKFGKADSHKTKCKIITVGDKFFYKGIEEPVEVEAFDDTNTNNLIIKLKEGSKCVSFADLTRAEENTVPELKLSIDGRALTLKPGHVISMDAGENSYQRIVNIFKYPGSVFDVVTDKDYITSTEERFKAINVLDLTKPIKNAHGVTIVVNKDRCLIHTLGNNPGFYYSLLNDKHVTQLVYSDGRIKVGYSTGESGNLNDIDGKKLAFVNIDEVKEDYSVSRCLLVGNKVIIAPDKMRFDPDTESIIFSTMDLEKDTTRMSAGTIPLTFLLNPEDQTELFVPPMKGSPLHFKVGDSVVFGSSYSFGTGVIKGFNIIKNFLNVIIDNQGEDVVVEYMRGGNSVDTSRNYQLVDVDIESIRKIDFTYNGIKIKVNSKGILGLPNRRTFKVVGKFTDTPDNIFLLENGHSVYASEIGDATKKFSQVAGPDEKVTVEKRYETGLRYKTQHGDIVAYTSARTKYCAEIYLNRGLSDGYYTYNGLLGYSFVSFTKPYDSSLVGFISPRLNDSKVKTIPVHMQIHRNSVAECPNGNIFKMTVLDQEV